MNVHISYKIPKTPEIESQIEHYIAKLRRRLQVYQPELIHLHATLDEPSAREGSSISLNLRLPSGQLAAQERGPNVESVIKSGFEDLIEQLAKHKDHLRNQYKWIRRRRTGRTRPQPQVPFEETLAAVKPDTASDGDVQSWINTNLMRLERFVDRQLRYRANSGDLPGETVSREEIIDEVVASALGEDEQKPERLGLEAWLYRLALRAIDVVVSRNRQGVDAVPLEASQRRPNNRASDEPQLQYHQPDEMFTAEDVIADSRVATPEQIAASDEMIGMVEVALLGASPEERDAFILFAVEGFTPEEIAAISDRKVEQVRQDIGKARDRLKNTITTPNEFKDKLLQHSKTA